VTTRRGRLGRSGERIGADHLERAGMRIVERNARRREGEIDLVAIEGETLVFVEVKLRSAGRPTGGAIESLSPAKRERLALLAQAYGADHPELPRDYRIDLLAIDLAVDGSVAAVRHLRNAIEG